MALGGIVRPVFKGGAFNASDFTIVHNFGTIGELIISQVGVFALAVCAGSFLRRRRSSS